MKYLIALLLSILTVSIGYASCSRFKIFQDIRVIEPSSIYNSCIGYIVGGWEPKGGPMYRIILTSCPNRKHISHAVTSGEEYIEALK